MGLPNPNKPGAELISPSNLIMVALLIRPNELQVKLMALARIEKDLATVQTALLMYPLASYEVCTLHGGNTTNGPPKGPAL